jgi:hypothetical protein
MVILFVFGSCKKDTTETTTEADKPAVSDTVISIKPEQIDPDPTDSIPAELYGINSSNTKTADLVRLTLQGIYKDDLSKNFIEENSRKFIFFEYDLNEDGKKEIFVGLTGTYFCGSGGCTQLILDVQGNVISTFSVSGYPVIIDNNKTNGWKDLFIYSGSKNRIVKFDGKTYPSNPSVLPELKLIPGDGLPRALNFINEPYPWFKF